MHDNHARAPRADRHPAPRGPALVALTAAVTVLAGCGPLQKFDPAPEHLETAVAREGIPAPVTQPPLPPPPAPARNVLFALSRDAGINVDISGDIQGNVTMNAIDQTLQQILDRISRQVSLRYQIENSHLAISPDLPFWRNYRIDYVNLSRGSEGEVSVATKVATTGKGGVDGQAGGESGGGGESEDGNISRTTVKSLSDNSFWAVVTGNIRQIITGRAAADGNGAITGNWNSTTNTDESRKVWKHLRGAGFIKGPVDGTAASYQQPTHSFGGLVGFEQGLYGLSGLVVVFGAVPGNIDQILEARGDDGNPSSGSIQGHATQTAYAIATNYHIAFRF